MTEKVLICLDWDGTLVDSFGRISSAVQDAAEIHSLPVYSHDHIQRLIGWPHEQIWSTLYPDQSENDALSQKFWATFTRVYNKKKSGLFPSTRLALQRMEKFAVLVIVTNKPRVFFDQEMIDFNLQSYFSATYSCSEYASKPEPEMINQAMSDHGQCSYVCMVGDAPADQMAAEKACVPFYKVNYNGRQVDTNIIEIADAIYDTVGVSSG